VIEASIDPDRNDKVVKDAHGLWHAAVICNRNSDDPYLVAMCEFFDAVDQARQDRSPESFKPPERRWPVADETRGPMTCLRCIGS
jgi:hypothetical protein